MLKNLFLFFGLFILSCTENPPTSPIEPSNLVRSVDGRIELSVVNSSNNLPELDILSFHEEDDIAANNTFDIDVHISGVPQMVFAVNSNSDLVLGATVLANTNEIIISESSTANTFILLNPIFMFADAQQVEEIIAKAATCTSYEPLVKVVAKIISEDPNNVYNSQKHPEILELSAKVGFELLRQYGNNENSKLYGITNVNLGSTRPNVHVNKNEPSKVVFENSNYVAISAEILNLYTYKKEQLFTLSPKESAISFRFGWPPIYWTNAKVTKIDFSKYPSQDLTIRATKGFDPKEMSNWYKPSTPTGRASLLNTLVLAKQVLKYFIGGAGIIILEKAVMDIKINLSASDEAMRRYNVACQNGDAINAAKALIDFISINKNVIVGAIIGVGAYYASKGLVKKALTLVKDYMPIIKVVAVTYQVTTETIPIVKDLVFGQRWFDYRIKTYHDGEIYYCGPVVENLIEVPLVKPIYKQSIGWFGLRSNGGFDMTTYSDDNRYEELKYHINVKISRKLLPDSHENYHTDFLKIGEEYYINKWYGSTCNDVYVKVQAENRDGEKSDWSAEHKAFY